MAAWLVPDPVERERVLYANFRIFVDHAIQHGYLLVTQDRCGTAVWFPLDTPLPEIEDYERRQWLACGPYTAQFKALDAAFEARHPSAVHHHLAFLAVHPDHQTFGLGTALMHWSHQRLDKDGIPAYLEASSLPSRDFYLRHRYSDLGDPIDLPDGGPRLWPMWREPRHRGERMLLSEAKRRQMASEVVSRYTGSRASIRDIAEDLGISYGLAHKLLVESGTPIRSQGAQRRWELTATEPGPSAP
ncbi:GNAT family N-acetyltransferase [Dactylosporangium sp. NPDC049525]|uniref:GNAT family N-acetyltransferase n=1 Tax=Dactylosporangium sp. NPDC049525 TaxID=3154730 RepID=UPI003439222A